jgi:hypothetical protein
MMKHYVATPYNTDSCLGQYTMPVMYLIINRDNLTKLPEAESLSFLPFVQPEGPLPCLQGPASGPYTEPNECTPHPATVLLQDQV